MDTISPEFRLDPTGSGTFTWSEWQVDDDHELIFHKPTRAVFSMYPAPDATDMATLSIWQMRARLMHVCDGFPVPGNLAELATSAIIAFAYMNTASICPVELRTYHPAFGTARRFRPLDCG
jgi:hypothetical protein